MSKLQEKINKARLQVHTDSYPMSIGELVSLVDAVKVQSLAILQKRLDDDLAWRKRELTTFKLMISGARTHQKKRFA